VPEREQDHRGVAVTMAVAFGGFDQSFDFGRGEVFARPEFGRRNGPTVRFTIGGNINARCRFAM
jgi:hypothetical protein